METLKVAIENISNGTITRDNDELYSGGFWDVAVEISNIDNQTNIDVCTMVYDCLWELYEKTTSEAL